MFKRILLLLAPVAAVAGLLAMLLGSAAPALADTSPVTVSATVPSSVTMSGLSASINFGSAPAGQTTTAAPDPAEVYTVATNNAHGATLQITPAAYTGLLAGDGNSMDNSALTVHETGHAAGVHSLANADPAHPVTIDNEPGAGSWSYSETWTLAVPASQPADTYTETLTYSALANP